MVTPPRQPNSDFSEFFQEFQKNNQTTLDSSLFPSLMAAPASNKMGFLGRTIDILSRPMRTISNPVMKALEAPERADRIRELRLSGDDAGAFKEFLNYSGALATAPITGFFSDKPENKPYWSDIIEKATDVANRNDPNYVDTANNANPVLKGVGGFIGDFILDPLWLVPVVGFGTKLAKTGTKVAKTVGDAQQAATTAVRQGDEIVTLTTRVGGKDREPQRFATIEEAEAALAAQQRRGSRPWVNADEVEGVIPRGTNSFRITREAVETPVGVPGGATAAVAKAANLPDTVPASAISQRLSDELLAAVPTKGESSAEFVSRVVGNMLDDAKTVVGGKETSLKNSFIETLRELSQVAAPAAKAGKPDNFDKWLSKLLKDDTVTDSRIAIPENSITLRGAGLGNEAILGYVLNIYRNTRNTEVKDAIRSLLLEPTYGRYASGIKAGKEVNALGNASTSAAVAKEVEAGARATQLLTTLTNLDDANAARLGALFGEEFVAILRKTDPQGVAQFLDDIRTILTKTGSIEALGRATPGSLLGSSMAAFGVDPAALSRAVSLVDSNIANIPNRAQQTLVQVAETVADNPSFQSNLRQVLQNLNYPVDRLGPGRSADDVYEGMVLAISKALPAPINNKLSKSYQDKNYPFEVQGVRKTDLEYLDGIGVIPLEPATYFQFDLFLSLAMKGVQPLFVGNKKLPVFTKQGTEFQGLKLATEKERLTLAGMKVIEDLLIERGVPLTIDYQGVFHKVRFSQVYEEVAAALNRNPEAGKNFLTYVFFNGNTGTAPTQFLEAVAKAMSGGNRAEVRELLTSAVDRNGRSIVNSEGKGINFLAGKKKMGQMTPFKKSNVETADKITDAIMDAVPSLRAIAKTNADDYLARARTEGTVVAQDAADYLVGLVNSPDKLAEAIRAVDNSESVVGDFARTINATELGATLANGAVKSGLGPGLKKNAEEIANLEKASLSGDNARVQKVKEEMLDSAEAFQARVRKEAEEIVEDAMAGRANLDNVPPGVMDDVAEASTFNAASTNDKIATDGYGTMWAWTSKILDPLNKIFNANRGMHVNEMPWGARMFKAQANSLHVLAARFLVPLRQLSKNNDFAAPVTPGSKTTVLQQAVRNIQQGVKSPEGTILRQAEDAYRPILAKVVDTTNDIQNFMLGNAFFRSGAGTDALNMAFDFNRVLGDKTPPRGIYFDRDLAEQTARARVAREAAEQNKPIRDVTDEDVTREMFNQWTTWDIDDPINFAYNINRAAIQVSTESGFVTAFRKKAIAMGVGSNKAEKDFVKYTFAEDSRYAKYFGDEPLYLHPDAAEMLDAIDTFAKSSKAFEGAFGQFVRTTLDPITDTWKYAITLPRPGHHIRNMVGDITLTYLAEGGFKALASSRHAFRTMGIKGSYEDIDVVRLLTGAGLEMPKATTVGVAGIKGKGGSSFDLTYADAYEEMILKGMLPPAKGREGLYKGRGFDEQEMVDTKVTRALEKAAGVVNPFAMRGGRMEDAIMNVAEGRDHFVRMQHFWQIMEKAKAGKKLTAGFGRMVDPKTMTKDELITFAVDRVAKYHPDLSTLSVFERKYLKRLMPFYHWNRGAFQAVMETTVMNPGRIMAFPKASYNIAVAAGINPYSLYDPFPDDQIFPSFLRDEMQGPQFEVGGRYYAVRPGIVTFDVLNQVRTGNPVDAVMSNLNPAFKIPLELLTGVRVDTGARIRDYSDYIDSSIPGVNYAANISSFSVTGSLTSLLTGGGFDRQLQYELGNKDINDQRISLLNWLTGVGLVDYSRPSYIRFAQNERRQEFRPDTGRSPF